MGRLRSQSYSAVYSRTLRMGLLSSPRRRLGRVVFTIYKYTASMTQALLRAASSQLIDPAFIKKLAAVKDNLEALAATVKMHSENNKEHGTRQLLNHAMVQVDEAANMLVYLWKILDLERAEL